MKAGYFYRSGKALLAHVSLPFMKDETFLIVQNKERRSENEPTLKVLKHIEKFNKNIEAGGIWEKVSKNGNPYKSMSLETPFVPGGKIYLTVFKLEQEEIIKGKDGKERKLIATINYSAPSQKNNTDFTAQNTQSQYAPQQDTAYQSQPPHTATNEPMPGVVMEDDEIPF